MSEQSSWRALFEGASLETVAAPAATASLAESEVRERIEAAMRGAGIVELLRASAKGAEVIAVANDGHRATRTLAVLETLFAVADAERIRIRTRLVVATGSHTSTAAERHAHDESIAFPLFSRLSGIIWHDAKARRRLAPVGPFRMNDVVAAARFLVAIGSCEPHYFAGVTGAHKTSTIGVMSRADIEANHARALDPDAVGLRLDGNPVHQGVCAALDALEKERHVLGVNLLQEGTRIMACTAGTPRAALASMLPRVRERLAHRLDAAQDVIVARVEGPLAHSLYQADKGIKNVERAVRDGGVLLLDAACPGGVGDDSFLSLLREAPDHSSAMRRVAERGYRLGDHKAVRLRALTDPTQRGVRIGVVAGGLAPETLADTGLTLLRDRTEAAAWAQSILKKKPLQVLVVDDAGNHYFEGGEPGTGSPS